MSKEDSMDIWLGLLEVAAAAGYGGEVNIELLKRGEQVFDEVSAMLKPRLYCAMYPWAEPPKCTHLVHQFGYCAATEKEQCFTLKDMLEKARERSNIDGC